ncbi:MAG: transmembrane 220 family protein [Bacteroidota bacterium]
MKTKINYTFAGLSALFLLFAIVQWNDPDSILWILLYADVAVFFGLAAIGKFFRIPALVMTALCAGIALFHLPGLMDFITNEDGIEFSQGMSNEFAYIEKAREFGGALIAGVALGWLFWKGKKAEMDESKTEDDSPIERL